MKLIQYIPITLLTLSLHSVFASETDGFTNRNEPLEDSSAIINLKANNYVSKALKDLNDSSSICNEAALYHELRNYFANHMSGQLVIEILNNNMIPKRPVTIENSVYKNWKPWDGIGLGLRFVSRSGITLAPILHIGDELIGADKFEHFFGQGFSYFTENYLNHGGMTNAIKMGIFKEKIFLGGNKLGNGVFSYGDLSANFNGMRFWNHILQNNDDVLGADHNLGPYIVCENNKWIKTKEIDFRDYIDSAMDESINCSKFPTHKTAEKFTREIQKLGMSCPLDPKKLEELSVKYGKAAKWIINREGTGVISYLGEFKNK
jgi:hypothetical protein